MGRRKKIVTISGRNCRNCKHVAIWTELWTEYGYTLMDCQLATDDMREMGYSSKEFANKWGRFERFHEVDGFLGTFAEQCEYYKETRSS